MRTVLHWLFAGLTATALVHGCVIDTVDDCYDDGSCTTGGAAAGAGATTADGGAGGGGDSTGGGGMTGCMGHADCTDTANAKCDGGSCVPCTDDEHCAGIAGADVCDDGVCVECAADKEQACDQATQTCNLIDHVCVDVAPGTVDTCLPCSNDDQCTDGRCVPLDFEMMTPHGYYCLTEFGGTCEKPFTVQIQKTSLNQTGTSTFCGPDEAAATCEAMLAVEKSCPSGEDGMCIPSGGNQEVPVPGAICKVVNAVPDTCTYPCTSGLQCPPTGANSCGNGGEGGGDYCGG